MFTTLAKIANSISQSVLMDSSVSSIAAQRSVHPIPGKERRGRGGGTLRGAFSGCLRGLELVPSKWRCLVPPTRSALHIAVVGGPTLAGHSLRRVSCRECAG